MTAIVNNRERILNEKLDFLAEYTNERLENWYKQVKEDYNVIGKGIAFYDKKEDVLTINYTENNETKEYKVYYASESVQATGIDAPFYQWCELS